MATGPGKYDDLCTAAREGAAADACVLIILGGTRGSGFSIQGLWPVLAHLPDMLEATAAAIRQDMAMGQRG